MLPARPEPFRVQVEQGALDDLRARLERTRWPDEPPGAGWSQGCSLGYLKELVSHWRGRFDWRAQEARLNALPQFRAAVDGAGIHFLLFRGRGQRPFPLILTHGWPSSFLEMLRLAPLLADPGAHGADAADAFDVVVPSLPGFGFSDPLPRYDRPRVVALWAGLMSLLGYERFGAHGGDIGAGITSRLARTCPERVAGIHITYPMDPALGPESAPLSAAEEEHLRASALWSEEEGAYAHLQSTRPQTLACGLADSPAGLAAWIVEKFRAWSDCGGEVESRFSKDELLANVSLYWLAGTLPSSLRYYHDYKRAPDPLAPGERIRVPCGLIRGPKEITRPPREWVERAYELRRWTELPRGGHFLAHEEPELLTRDLREFFRPLR